MFNFISTAFIPHGHCYLWKTELVSLHVISDSLTALAYFCIPIILVYLVQKREDILFDWVVSCFGAFIILCGCSHLAEVWTLWYPNYWLSGWLKACTALISVITAYLLYYLIPKLVAIPSVLKLEALNIALEKEIVERKQIENELNRQTQQLEKTLKELRHTQSFIVQSEKMSSLGQMVAGVAHEINNPVSFIYSNIAPARNYAQDLLRLVELYQQHYPHPASIIEKTIQNIELDFLKQDFIHLIDSMEVGAQRISQIVISLRNFSRFDESELKAVNIHEGIESTFMILKHRLTKSSNYQIEIIKKYSQLPLVKCYTSLLNQVFMNVLANAIDALEEEKSNVQPQPNKFIAISTELINENWVAIKIYDNGVGIPLDIQPKIFDPFYTTKPIGKGTGLGLSISYQIIVDRHQGQLSCKSIPGESSEFIIEIPINQPSKQHFVQK